MAKSTDRRVPLVFVGLHLIVTAFTWRDLNTIDESRLRGPKWFWRLATGLNSVGTVAYFLVGRRGSTPSPGRPARSSTPAHGPRARR